MGLEYPVRIPKNLSAELCRFLGVMHGDGNMSSSRILITDECLRYHKSVLHPMFEELFGVKLNLYHDKNRNSYYSHVKSKKIYEFLVCTLKINRGAVRENLVLPSFIYKVPNKLKSEYIAGLYDSESYVSKRQAEIEFSITSEEIYKFILDFLSKNTIKHSKRIRNRRKKKDYTIHIYGKENISNFLNIVEIKHPEKVARINKFLAH